MGFHDPELGELPDVTPSAEGSLDQPTNSFQNALNQTELDEDRRAGHLSLPSRGDSVKPPRSPRLMRAVSRPFTGAISFAQSGITQTKNCCLRLPIVRSVADRMERGGPFKYIVYTLMAALLFVAILGVVYFFGGKHRHGPSGPEFPGHGCTLNPAAYYRLPRTITPLRYNLSIDPDLDAGRFHGHVFMDLHIHSATRCVVMHALNLDLESVVLEPGALKPTAISFSNDERQFVSFLFAAPIEPTPSSANPRVLHIHYTGRVSDDLAGFYRANFTLAGDVDPHQQHRLGVTQFESVYARRAFPCFDEPDFKAEFALSLSAPLDFEVRSNMPASYAFIDSSSATAASASSALGAARMRHIFPYTPPMSTYLLAWVMGRLEFVNASATLVNGTTLPVRVYTLPGQGSRGQFAVDWAAEVIAFYSRDLDFDFPLPKLDLLAIPDFEAGAMENWGIVTYRDTAILVDPDTSESQRQWVASVIAHELAHQWFGDLVTTGWWSNIWLNEGFATYFSYYCVDSLRPDWASWDQFNVNEILPMLDVDARLSTHAIVPKNISTPEEDDEIFDDISYNKGGALLRMIRSYLEVIQPGSFLGGLRVYLKQHAYGNTLTPDLFKTWSDYVQKPELLENLLQWTSQPGFPVVNASLLADGSLLLLEQHRFLITATAVNDSLLNSLEQSLGGPQQQKPSSPKSDSRSTDSATSTDSERWWIPVLLESSTGAVSLHTIANQTSTGVSLVPSIPTTSGSAGSSGSPWTINAGGVGLYLTAYADHTQWSRVRAAVRAQSIDAADRFAFVVGSLMLSEQGGDSTGSGANVISVTDALGLLDDLVNETSYDVWSAALSHLGRLQSRLQDDTLYGNLTAYIVSRLSTVRDYVGWGPMADSFDSGSLSHPTTATATATTATPETVELALLRSIILPALDALDDPTVVSRARWIWDNTPLTLIHPAVRGIVYASVVRHGGQREYDAILHRYESSDSANERARCLSAIALTRRPYLLRATLDYALSDRVRVQDALYLVRDVVRTPLGRDVAWTWLRENWATVAARYRGSFQFIRLLTAVAGSFTNQAQFVEAYTFFRAHLLLDASDADGALFGVVRQSLEIALATEQWVARNRDSLVAFLNTAAARLDSEESATALTPLELSMTAGRVFRHLRAFQAAADANGGIRFTGGPGFNASRDYVLEQLRGIPSMNVTVQEFDIPYSTTTVPPTLALQSPMSRTFLLDTDFNTLEYTGSGNITNAPFSIVKNLGCNETDFADVVEGSIALIVRGQCTFQAKAEFATARKAVAAVIYNDVDRKTTFHGTCESQMTIPVLGASYPVGSTLALLAAQSGRASISVQLRSLTLHATNIIADTLAGRPDRVITLGAHLDSVEAGPGINDNGSGSATILELALQWHALGLNPVNRLRFCWYAGEELGLLGSEHYAESLNATGAIANVAMNLNFDMLGSPNYARMIYNGSSATDPKLQAPSVVIQRAFERTVLRDYPFELREFDDRSDYASFMKFGVPAGGLDTGAEVIKTQDQRRKFGGVANAAFDPCYHQACDTVDNVNPEILELMARSMAGAVQEFAMDLDLHKTLWGSSAN